MKKHLLVILSIFLMTVFLYPQNGGTITGNIKNQEGSPLVGVNVMLKEQQMGDATDSRGNYRITGIPAGNYTLVATYIGYSKKTQEIDIQSGETLEIDFNLERKALMGDQVVKIGYGTEQRSDISGSIASVETEEIQKVESANLLNNMQGKLSGVAIQNYSGAPGESPVMRIRGIGTMNNSDPLYVIDGIPGDISQVNPNSIKSVSVMKDASASAIYGSRAANGVVLIETKSGREDQPFTISFQSSYGIQNIVETWDMLGPEEYLEEVSQLAIKGEKNNESYTMPPAIQNYVNNPDSFLANMPRTDWVDEYHRENVPVQNYQLSLSGGGNDFKYFISGSYYDETGIQINSNSYAARLTINSEYNKGDFTIGETIKLGRKYREPQADVDSRNPLQQLLGLPPVTSPYDEDRPHGFGGPGPGWGTADRNALAEQTLTELKEAEDYANITGYMTYDFTDNFQYKLRANYSPTNHHSYHYEPMWHLPRDVPNKRQISDSRWRDISSTIENIFTYDRQIKDHNVNIMAGLSREYHKWREVGAWGQEMPADGLDVIDAVQANEGQWGSENVSKLNSMFTRLKYNYSGKYLLNLSIRRDGSSKFPEGNRWGNFPSFSAAWKVSEESFFDYVPYSNNIDNLKLKYSYGSLGNNRVGEYTYIPTVSFGGNLNYQMTNDVMIGSAITNLPSGDLRWEETIKQNMGINLALFDNKLNFTAEYYENKTEDILFATPIPPTVGAGEPETNLASMKNTGFDFSFEYGEYLEDMDFNYSISGNVSKVKNEVLSLAKEGQEIWTSGISKTVVGKEIGAFHLFETDGLFQSEDQINNHTGPEGDLVQPNAQPGDVKFVDQNNDGTLNSDDKVYMGSGFPDWQFGFSFSGEYKNFDLSLSLDGVAGKKMYNGLRKYLMGLTQPEKNWPEESKDRWTPQNTDTDIPRATVMDPNLNYGRHSDLWLEDADYLRLRNIQLGYTLPEDNFGLLKDGSIRFYLSGENLWTLTGYKGVDPTVSPGGAFSKGHDWGTYPTVVTIRSGIEITFK